MDLAAGGLRQGTGANQHDFTGCNVMLPGDRFANSGDDFADDDLLPVGAFDFLDHDQPLFIVLVEHAERRATVSSQSRMAILHRVLDVLRIVVHPAYDDQILDPTCNEEFVVVVEEAEIPRSPVRNQHSASSPAMTALNTELVASGLRQ